MAALPPTFSPRWLAVLAVTAVFWIGAALLAAYYNTGKPPTLETLAGASAALSGIAAAPAVFGFFGARLGFVLAHVGLLIGYLNLLRSFGTHSQGFEDLAAVAMFVMLGIVGLAVGLVIDIVRYFVRRRSGASQAA